MAQLQVGNTLVAAGWGEFQNWDVTAGNFLPFAFSGAIHNATGDNLPATLAFPNNDISISFILQLVNERRVVSVAEVINGSTVVFAYQGQVVGASMTETEIVMQLGTFLDAVTTEFPWKFLTEDLVGPLPTTSSVSVR